MKRIVLALGVLAVATAATAMADDGGFGLGAGIVTAKDWGIAPLWVTANYRLMLADNVALEPEIGWYRVTDNFSGGDIIDTGDVHMDVFNGGGSLLLIYPLEKVAFFAGAGLGAHLYRFSGGSGSASTQTHVGYHGLAGVDVKASRRISLFGAVRYEIIHADTIDFVKQWKIYGGVRFRSH